MTLHYYSDLAAPTTLSVPISNSATSITIGGSTGFPASFPYYLCIDLGQTDMEVVEVTAGSGVTFTVNRGVSGTTAVSHSLGATITHVAPAQFFNDTSQHTNASAGVHGVTGSVVGTTDAQTLTNKTIDFNSNTILNATATNVTGVVAVANGGTNATTAAAARTNLGVAIGSNVEAWSAGLDALSTVLAGATAGLLAQTNTNTVVPRTLAAGSSKVSITNPAGIAGNPTIDVVTANITSIPTANVAFNTPVPFVFTSSSTFTSANAGTAQYLRIRCVNGGGAAGGTAATVSQAAVSGAGAGGAYAEKVVAVSGLTFPLQVSVGTGGGGGGPGNFQGGAGGQSSVTNNNGAGAVLCTPGAQTSNQAGQGGAASVTNGAVGVQGFDGTTSGGVGDVVIPGQPAGKGVLYSGGGAANGCPGGNSHLGSGGYDGANAAGHAGFNYGGGAGGHAVVGTQSALTGAAGGNGVVIIENIY